MRDDQLIGVLSKLIGIPEQEVISAISAPIPVSSIRLPSHPSEWKAPHLRQTQNEGASKTNQEMANKINELYNELNQKDKDLKEAQETVRRLQGEVRRFRQRAEEAEQKAATTLSSYNGLAAEFNNLLERHRAVKAALRAAKNQTVYTASNQSPVASVDFAFPGTKDKTVVHTPDVDAIDIPLSAAEEIIRKIQGA